MVDKITTPVTPLEEVAKINEIIDNLGSGSSGGWSLLEHKWTEALLDDESWLLANNFSWHNKAAYEDAYNQLVDDIDGITPTTETVGSYTVTYYQTTSGRKIVLADQETSVSNIYTESGVAWYYILDTTNERFKLPRENPAREELIQVVRAKGNGKTLGINLSATGQGIAGQLGGASGGSGYANAIVTNTTTNPNLPFGVSTDPTKSGIISSMTDSTSVYKGKQYLYFYVGQFSQTATEQTAGLNTELFNGKADVDLNNVSAGIDFVIESYQNGTEWYRLYKSGWVEQGGMCNISKDTATTVTLQIPMANTNYFISITARNSSTQTGGDGNFTADPISTTQFYWRNGDDFSGNGYWEVKGMSAQS